MLREEIHFLYGTTLYSFSNLSPTATFTVVKLGRAERSVSTAPGLCVWIFTLVRVTYSASSSAKKAARDFPPSTEDVTILTQGRLEGPLHTGKEPNSDIFGSFHISV